MATEKYVDQLLNRLIDLDVQTNEAYYEMGQILHAFFEGQLHTVLGYQSYGHMVEEELSYTPSTAANYRNIYAQFKRLHYNKVEALDLIDKFGITRLNDVLPQVHSKAGVRAIRNKIEALDMHQINFSVTTANLKECHAMLVAYGAEITDEGRVLHASDAFMDMVHGHKVVPKLKAVS